MTVAFAMNVSVVNAKISTGQGGTGKEFMMAMMVDGPIDREASDFAYGNWEYGTYQYYNWEYHFAINRSQDYPGLQIVYTLDGNDPVANATGSTTTYDTNIEVAKGTYTLKLRLYNVDQSKYIDDYIYSWTVECDNSGAITLTYNHIISGGGSEKPKSAKPFIKYLEDNTADPVRKVIYADGHYTAYTNRKYTTGETLPSETSTEVDLDYTFGGYVIASNPINGTKYNLIATEGDNYSYSDPVSFTYNSANIPVISCENNTVTISNPNNLYTIHYAVDPEYGFADEGSTTYSASFTISKTSKVKSSNASGQKGQDN